VLLHLLAPTAGAQSGIWPGAFVGKHVLRRRYSSQLEAYCIAKRGIMNDTYELAEPRRSATSIACPSPCRGRGPSRLWCSRAGDQPAILNPAGRTKLWSTTTLPSVDLRGEQVAAD
jgi:hypothetical protein